MTANDSKYLNISNLNNLVDQYSNPYHHSISKETAHANYSDSTEIIETNPKDPKFKVNDTFKTTKQRMFLVKVTLTIGQKKYLLSTLIL